MHRFLWPWRQELHVAHAGRVPCYHAQGYQHSCDVRHCRDAAKCAHARGLYQIQGAKVPGQRRRARLDKVVRGRHMLACAGKEIESREGRAVVGPKKIDKRQYTSRPNMTAVNNFWYNLSMVRACLKYGDHGPERQHDRCLV